MLYHANLVVVFNLWNIQSNLWKVMILSNTTNAMMICEYFEGEKFELEGFGSSGEVAARTRRRCPQFWVGPEDQRGAVRHHVGHVQSFPAEKVDSVLGSFWCQDQCVHCNLSSNAASSVVLYSMYIIIYYWCFLYSLSLARIPLPLESWSSYWRGSSFNTYLYPQTQWFDSMSQLSSKPSKNHHELSVSMFRSEKNCYNTSVLKISSF